MSEQTNDKKVLMNSFRHYVDLGLPVIPLCSHTHEGYSPNHTARCACAGKSPLIKGWPDHAQTTMAQVTSWLREFPPVNIGMPLGHPSGYVGIDVDGFAGEDMLDEMSQGDLPETWSFRTGDGFRLIYEIPIGLITKKFVNQDKAQEHTECSILAYGQQTVMPPSIHHTGRKYEWDEGRSPHDINCAMAPDWLIDLVRDDSGKSRGAGTIDFTSDRPTYTPPEKETDTEDTLEINPIVITDTGMHLEFLDYYDIEIDVRKPSDYVGKQGKGQDSSSSKGMTAEELTQVLSEGGRDNGMTKVIGHFCATMRHLGKDYILMMAQMHNQQFCKPPLDTASIEDKVSHFWEKEEMKSAEFAAKRGEDDRKQFAASEVAQVVLNELESKGYVLKASPQGSVIWMTHKDHGPWEPINVSGDAQAFQKYIVGPLISPELGGEPSWGTKRNFGEVAAMLHLGLIMANRIWPLDMDNVNTQSASQHKYIPLAGGKLLEWKTGKLLPWDPESHLTYVIPVEYDPEAKAPNWEKRLKQWLPEEGTRNILQEYVGYSFIPYMGIEKTLWIQGSGANGKSMFLETIQAMLGRKITSAASMSILFSRFGKMGLQGKILNIVNEAGADYLRGGMADEFKNMVSGGAVVADVKNKDAVTFNNTAKFIFSANHDIKTSDKSGGWERRMILVPFEQNFRNSKENKTDIMDELTAEFPGILNWAIAGLQRLMVNQQFTTSEVVNTRMKQYLSSNDVAADFFENCLRIRPEFEVNGEPIERGVAAGSVTDLFKLWCAYRSMEVKKFSERIKDHMTNRNIQCARKSQKYLTMSDAVKTTAWINVEIHVTDPEFLEYICKEEIFSMTNMKLKHYVSTRLEELNNEPTPPSPPTVQEISSKAE